MKSKIAVTSKRSANNRPGNFRATPGHKRGVGRVKQAGQKGLANERQTGASRKDENCKHGRGSSDNRWSKSDGRSADEKIKPRVGAEDDFVEGDSSGHIQHARAVNVYCSTIGCRIEVGDHIIATCEHIIVGDAVDGTGNGEIGLRIRHLHRRRIESEIIGHVPGLNAFARVIPVSDR